LLVVELPVKEMPIAYLAPLVQLDEVVTKLAIASVMPLLWNTTPAFGPVKAIPATGSQTFTTSPPTSLTSQPAAHFVMQGCCPIVLD